MSRKVETERSGRHDQLARDGLVRVPAWRPRLRTIWAISLAVMGCLLLLPAAPVAIERIEAFTVRRHVAQRHKVETMVFSFKT